MTLAKLMVGGQSIDRNGSKIRKGGKEDNLYILDTCMEFSKNETSFKSSLITFEHINLLMLMHYKNFT